MLELLVLIKNLFMIMIEVINLKWSKGIELHYFELILEATRLSCENKLYTLLVVVAAFIERNREEVASIRCFPWS